ncbi:hypothetical protein BCR44DRAFT_47283 [Catenaria anguillulae PL171]|uniref:F-box domain-containing protein n=1 Tax=Catenaria anguillulae PL171 TaxID=765915 RepID=A0A1Y2HPY7_9FUNG|nr:hypothetical protein BCR44DRAFT_47283 [Catenaria anguillulae PL171]
MSSAAPLPTGAACDETAAADVTSASITSPATSMSLIDRLAEETWLAILHWVALDPATGRGPTWLARCSATCSMLHRICNDPSLWRAAFVSINGKLGLDPKGRWPELHELSSSAAHHLHHGRNSPSTPASPTCQWRTVVKEQVVFNQTWRGAHKKLASTSLGATALQNNVEEDAPSSLSIQPAPFSTTVLGLCFPPSYHESPHVGKSPRRLSKIDTVRIYTPPPDKPHHQPLIAIVADWARASTDANPFPSSNDDSDDSDDSDDEQDPHDPLPNELFRIAHVLDANTYQPLLTYPLTYRHPQSHQLDHYNLLALDHQSLIILFQDDDECEAHLINYRDADKDVVHSFQDPPPAELTDTPIILPGSPSFAPVQAHLHPDGNYRFIIRATWLPQLVIQRRSPTTLAHLFGGDTHINTRCICFFYQADLPDVIVTGDRRGAVHVWSVETGNLLYAYQAGTMTFVTFTMFRPWLRPALAPAVVRKHKWLQVFSLVRGMPLDFTNPPGTTLHSVPAAAIEAPVEDVTKSMTGDAASEAAEEFDAFAAMMDAALQGGTTPARGVAWVGGDSGVTEAQDNRPCYLFRERPEPMYRRKAYVAAWNLMLVIDVAGRAFALDLVSGEEAEMFASVGVTVDAVERLLASQDEGLGGREGRQDLPKVSCHELNGQQLVRSITLSNAKILDSKPKVQPRVRCDLMFLDANWDRLLMYRGNTVLICSPSTPLAN